PASEPGGDALGRIADLPPDHRAVVVLRYVLEYTPGEIAELLDLPRGTVNSRLRRGLDRMKELEPGAVGSTEATEERRCRLCRRRSGDERGAAGVGGRAQGVRGPAGPP